ncbi:hypothetical protein LXL04_001939 [Taraxacum kok-saghyz]
MFANFDYQQILRANANTEDTILHQIIVRSEGRSLKKKYRGIVHQKPPLISKVIDFINNKRYCLDVRIMNGLILIQLIEISGSFNKLLITSYHFCCLNRSPALEDGGMNE